jgi:imidazoleglycerol phosphate synthase glutamine amidotransferase subunit HisH
MTAEPRKEVKKEVWMLDTFGNVHSLVNACEKLGFKVNRVTSAKDLESADVLFALNSY